MTDETFVKLMRECGTDEQTIAGLLAREKQSRSVIKDNPVQELRPKLTSFPRPADGIGIFERVDRVWKWVQLLDKRHRETEKSSEDMFKSVIEGLNALADEAGAEAGKLQKQVYELKAQLEEIRGEIALRRAGSPKRSRQKAQPEVNGENRDAHLSAK